MIVAGRVLEVALSFALVWLILAGLASSLLEGVRLLFARRQKALFASVGTLLDGTDRPTANGATAALYRTEQLRLLVPWRRRLKVGRQRPLTWYRRRPPDPAARLAATGPEWIPPIVFGSIVADPDFRSELPRGVTAAIAGPDGKPCAKRAASWFQEAMRVVSVGYRRTTRGWLFLIGLLAAVAFQIDALTVATELWRDQDVRDQVIRAGQPVVDAQPLTEIPIGWRCPTDDAGCGLSTRIGHHLRVMRLIGWPATALAIALGAPFWFEIVGKITRARDRRGSIPTA